MNVDQTTIKQRQTLSVASVGLICTICNQQYTKYTCPKCNICYCSLPCYKQHSNHCTQQFHTNQLHQFMMMGNDTKDREQLKKQTSEMLNRFHQQQQEQEQEQNEQVNMMDHHENWGDDNNNSNDNDRNVWDEISDEEFNSVLAQLETMTTTTTSMSSTSASSHTNHDRNEDQSRSDDSTTMDALPSKIRRDFEKALIDGRLSKWMSLWKPWWLLEQGISNNRTRVVVLTDGDDTYDDSLLPSLSQLSNNGASPVLSFYLIEILFGYAYLQRIFNGELTVNDSSEQNSEDDQDNKNSTSITSACFDHVETELLFDFVPMLLTLCCNSLHLKLPTPSSKSKSIHTPSQNAVLFENMRQVALTIMENCQNPSVFHSVQYSISVLKDVSLILQHKASVMRCLRELQLLVVSAVNRGKQTKNNTPKNRLERMARSSFASSGKANKQLKLLEHKIYFYRCWCNELTESYLFELSQEAEREYEEQLETNKS